MSILDYWKEVDADGVTHYQSHNAPKQEVEHMPSIRFSQGMPAGYEVVWSEDWERYFAVRNRHTKAEYIDGTYACRWAARKWCVADAQKKREYSRDGNPLHISSHSVDKKKQFRNWGPGWTKGELM